MSNRVLIYILLLLKSNFIIGQIHRVTFNDSRYLFPKNSKICELKDSLSDGEYDVFYDSSFKQLAIKGYVERTKKNGKIIKYYENGNLAFMGSFRNNLMDGKWSFFYNTGLKHSVVNYANGLKNGEFDFYYYSATNKLQFKKFYKLDIDDSTETEYYPDGKIKSLTYWTSMSYLKKNFYNLQDSSGINIYLETAVLFVNNERTNDFYQTNGKSYITHCDFPNSWFTNGFPISNHTLNKNDLSISEINYYSNGRVKSTGRYSYKIDNTSQNKAFSWLKDGHWKFFDENGRLIKDNIIK